MQLLGPADSKWRCIYFSVFCSLETLCAYTFHSHLSGCLLASRDRLLLLLLFLLLAVEENWKHTFLSLSLSLSVYLISNAILQFNTFVMAERQLESIDFQLSNRTFIAFISSKSFVQRTNVLFPSSSAQYAVEMILWHWVFDLFTVSVIYTLLPGNRCVLKKNILYMNPYPSANWIQLVTRKSARVIASHCED